MNFITNKYKQTKKAIAHYLNPNQNPTDKQKKALDLLNNGKVKQFIEYLQKNTDININVVDYGKASFLIKAQDVANNTSPEKKKIAEDELLIRAKQAVLYLLQRGVIIDYRDKNGITALLSSCHWGNTEIAQILLQHGADPNLPSNQNNFYTNPLLSAYYKKNTQLVILLLKYGADVEQTIEIGLKGNGFQLNEDDTKYLRSLGNIVALVRRRREDQKNNVKNLLTELPELIFQDICFNV